jgi:hypothetical protein
MGLLGLFSHLICYNKFGMVNVIIGKREILQFTILVIVPSNKSVL